ncbi:MAG: SoxR reducing system RseC family protein [Rhodocyclaceae bacterium]|nr:SoxR reducing system RseC family protein [Rhodocyclaceae bacterium]
MEMNAEVLAVDKDHVLVKVSEHGGGCGRCNEAGGCNSGVLTQVFGRRAGREFRLENSIGARAGDRVVVSLGDGVTLKTALAVYMVPVLLVILGAGLGTWLGAGDDLPAGLGAGLGLVTAIAFVAWFRGRMAADGSSHPVLARRAEPSTCRSSRD